MTPASGRGNASACRDCVSIGDRTHELEPYKGFVVSSRFQVTELLPLSVVRDRRAMHGYKAYILAAGRRRVARAGRPTKRLFRYAHCMLRRASRHLPLEIVRSGTASCASILPQGQVSAAQTPPAPHTRLHPASRLHYCICSTSHALCHHKN